MILLKNMADLQQFSRQGLKVALVPTMGALHAGHLSLVSQAKQLADFVVVSIFVNPTQFGPLEDFDSYPRNLEADLQMLEQFGADAVFTPSTQLMYPSNSAVTIDPGPTANILEGASRPGHFAGVCQVVAKLFNLVRPNVAIFGQKDAQQLAIIRQMVRDLSYPIQIVGAPIVRDLDGLALSSRNAYLSHAERQSALALNRALELEPQKAFDYLAASPGVEPIYVALVTNPNFEVLTLVETAGLPSKMPEVTGSQILAVAARVGSTRLIDNRILEFPND